MTDLKDTIKAFGLEFDLYEDDGERSLAVSQTEGGLVLRLDSNTWSDLDATRLAGFLMKHRLDKNQKHPISDRPKIRATPIKVEADKRVPVIFTFRSETASHVILAGNFNGWDTKSTFPLTKQNNDFWKVVLNIFPGEYEYKFIVDGVWHTDPNNMETVTSQSGIINSLIRVKAPKSSLEMIDRA